MLTTPQLLDEAHMSDQRDNLIEFVATELLTTASRLQSSNCSSNAVQAQQVVDDFVMELIQCISNLPVEEV